MLQGLSLNVVSTVAGAAIALSGAASTHSGAHATKVVQPASQGICHPNRNGQGPVYVANGFGGWCDGTGPDSYRAFVDCKGPHPYTAHGNWVWFGDRTGSWAFCARGWNADPYHEGFEAR
jgi:hypothetical protein